MLYFPKWINDEPFYRTIDGQQLSINLVKSIHYADFQIKHIKFLNVNVIKIDFEINFY